MSRTVQDIARDIQRAWGAKVHKFARPYLTAMLSGNYGCDEEEEVVLRFLSNASTFRGADAQMLKAQLKATVKRS